MTNECQELQNIKYKTMLLNGAKKTFTNIVDNIVNVDVILDSENEKSKKESWNKLDKSAKMKKITQYIEKIKPIYNLNNEEIDILKQYLSYTLDKKNLQKNKDVIYEKESGVLEQIPNLHFNNNTRKFTLRKGSQLSAAKLGPTKKNNKTKNNNKRSKSPSDSKILYNRSKSPESPSFNNHSNN